MKIVLVTPARRFIANRFGLGYQIPLGHVLLGGPLLKKGHDVTLIDNDVRGLSLSNLAKTVQNAKADLVLIGHTASTAAHPVSIKTARAIRAVLPDALIVYGGVYPSYADTTILARHNCIDIIVRGEGEATILELVETLRDELPKQRKLPEIARLGSIKGITWREGQEIIRNPERPAIQNLDEYSPGWELVDWSAYKLFGFGRAAGMQFSRGCTLSCTYCGQWSFWKKYRHRSPENFVDELERLVRDYRIKIVWLADENFAAHRETTLIVLEEIIKRNLNISLNLNMTAADVVRDADIFNLYKQAGVDNIVMGIETLEDSLVEKIRKNNPLDVSKQAMAILRKHEIVSLVNVIFGLAEETFASLKETYRRLKTLDPDILNAVYITPHFWTRDGRAVTKDDIIQPDLTYWTYRNQIINSPGLSPTKLFLGVKLLEARFHLRPRALARILWSPGRNRRFVRVLRSYMFTGLGVFIAELFEFFFQARRVRPGGLEEIPGFPAPKTRLADPEFTFGPAQSGRTRPGLF